MNSALLLDQISDLAPGLEQPPAIMVVGHGSRRAETSAEFNQLLQRLSERLPNRTIAHSYLEIVEPLVDDGLQQLAQQHKSVTVLPVILFRAGHAKKDIPDAVHRAQHLVPSCHIQMAEVLGCQSLMAEWILRQVMGQQSGEQDAVLVVCRGSRDSQATADFHQLISLAQGFSRMRGIESTFAGCAEKDMQQTLEQMSAQGYRSITVVPYFLFTGVLVERMQHTLAQIARQHTQTEFSMTSYIGSDDVLVDGLLNRLHQVELARWAVG